MSNILSILIIAMIVEAVWETLKMVWQSGKISVDKIGAIVIGILLAVGAQIDLFSYLGVPIVIPYLGMVLTGILISRGANYIHDLLGKIEKPVKTEIIKEAVDTIDYYDDPCCACGCDDEMCKCYEGCECENCNWTTVDE